MTETTFYVHDVWRANHVLANMIFHHTRGHHTYHVHITFKALGSLHVHDGRVGNHAEQGDFVLHVLHLPKAH